MLQRFLAALSSHPDKVSENERASADIKFKSISKAYEILSDDDSRHVYDTQGMSAFEAGHRAGMGQDVDLDDILAQMFGMGGMGGLGGMGGMGGMGMNGGGPGGPRMRRPGKGANEEHEYTVTLEELYKGKTTKFASKKNVICSRCKGKGGKEEAKPRDCSSCQGRGMQQGLKSLGGGMVTQETVVCKPCKGTGKVYKEKDRCRRCKGERVTEEKKVLELYIPRGSREGEKIVLEGEADQLPDQEPGSIIFNLVESAHDTFTRAGANLSADVHVNLAEALCGFSRILVKHLDGRGIHVKYPQRHDGPLKPGSVIKVAGEGMPHKKSDLRGDLFLIVNIDFPDRQWLIQDQHMAKIKELLPKSEDPIQSETVDEVDYEHADLDDFAAEEQGGDAAQWEDEDEEDGAGPQCAQQ
ncbi:MAG: hypothetical protein Q9183_002307 [Haloplaca sp. 2 TL-2023]